MADPSALEQFRNQSHFETWAGDVEPSRIEASQRIIDQLVEDLIALGPKPSESDARQKVNDCVESFNEIDEGWICTIEREDICCRIEQIVGACGFDCDEDWLDERDW